ncbi:MAG TPA: hypothetical protein VGI44_05310, partial [Acidimicrobiales bacterium]
TNLNDEAFPDKLSLMCREYGVLPSQIVLELTETATSRDAMRLKAILSRIRLKGFRLALWNWVTSQAAALLGPVFTAMPETAMPESDGRRIRPRPR